MVQTQAGHPLGVRRTRQIRHAECSRLDCDELIVIQMRRRGRHVDASRYRTELTRCFPKLGTFGAAAGDAVSHYIADPVIGVGWHAVTGRKRERIGADACPGTTARHGFVAARRLGEDLAKTLLQLCGIAGKEVCVRRT